MHEGTALVTTYGVLIATLFPGFYYVTRLLPGNIPDSMALRLASAGVSLACVAAVHLVKPLRAQAYRIQLCSIGFFLIALLAVLVDSGNNVWYATGIVIGLFGCQYAFLRWQELVAAYAIAIAFQISYSFFHAHYGLGDWQNLYAIGTVLFSSVICIASGTMRLRTLHSEVRGRIRLELQAYYDGLTGIPNRIGMNERIDRALGLARSGGHEAALLYLDLNGFKEINDTYGHDTGDAVLIEAAQRIARVLRKNEAVGRLGGDEFIVILPFIDSSEEPIAVAKRIEEALRHPFRSGDAEIEVSASIGLSTYPRNATALTTLLAHADKAMYEAKRDRRAALNRVKT